MACSDPADAQSLGEQFTGLAGGVATGEIAVRDAARIGDAALHQRAVVHARLRVADDVEAVDGLVVPVDDAAMLVGEHAGRGDAAAGHAMQRNRIERCLQQRSEEHTSELQSLMRISYAVFCLKTKNKTHTSSHTRINIINKHTLTHNDT